VSELPEDLQMWGTRVLLRAVSDGELSKKSAGGIDLPDSVVDRQKNGRWEIVAVGNGVQDIALQPGAHAIASRWAGQEWKHGDETYRVAYAHDIVGILTGGN
jgi:co-chaperonin GroES (HSP10)